MLKGRSNPHDTLLCPGKHWYCRFVRSPLPELPVPSGAKTSIGTTKNLQLDGDNNWTNLVVGVRQTVPINERWRFVAKGDIADDFGDEFSSVITLGVSYDISKLLDVKFGYRYAMIEYEDSDIIYDQTIDGVFVGSGFNWQV